MRTRFSRDTIRHKLDLILLTLGLGLLATTATLAQTTPRTAVVHLFEWRWDDIAKECENFLGPKGFAAVQVSPPNEHRVVAQWESGRPPFPWWQRYQPVSYDLVSRSGDEQQFRDMVQRCQNAGVKIYVDAVINHMTGPAFSNDPAFGTASGGGNYNYLSYPPFPNAGDFHNCAQDIGSNYHDRGIVQNCRLVGLADLDTGASHVRNTLAGYLNNLVTMGVAGFRIDAAKHMDSNDIRAILDQVPGDPLIMQEVIESNGEPITGPEYFQNGLVTEFDYGKKLAEFFRGGPLASLRTFGESWQELMPSDQALVFVDNHDKQRGHGGGGSYLTHKDGGLYDLANVFMLAWPYGYPRVMSSYEFSDGDAGPPSDGNGNTHAIYQGNTPNCFQEWKCEHRWRPIANMVAFRNHTLPAWSVDNWWDNGNNQIAFGRGDLGFVVINNEGSALNNTYQTGLPAGQYCNAWDGEMANGGCTGTTLTVHGDGTAQFQVAPHTAAAIHVGAKIGSSGGSADMRRTVVFIEGETVPGQDMFVRGGIDHEHANNTLNRNCSTSNFNCAIPIQHRNDKNPTTNPWKTGDNYLDWYGRESNQNGTANGIQAAGTALDWTIDQWPPEWGEKRTVQTHGFGQEPLNHYGPHYWMLDVDMDCSQTADGWFELKSYIANGAGWEGDIDQSGTPYPSKNHFGRCGHVNVYRRDQSQPVEIVPLPQPQADVPADPPTASTLTLGASYSPTETTFAIWSPDSGDAQLRLDGQTHALQRLPDANGYTDVYGVTVPGDHHLKPYHFLVNGRVVRDPYGVMVEPGTDNNIVMDISAIEPEGGWAPHPPLPEREDAVIYEVHVRDFTIDPSSGVDPDKRGKFLGMVQRGTTHQGKSTGIDHLLELGVTHVQLLPIYDFASCSPKDPGNSPTCYNWGYDPENYNVPDERYSQSPTDYVERARELKTMINEFHKAGLRVVMDVVYNHTGVTSAQGETMLGNISNRYFTPTDLSGAGNGIDASRPMVSRMIRDSLEFWAREYRLDGFRFDLIGVFDYAAAGDWGRHLNERFPERQLLIYGEPWNGFAADPRELERVRLGTVARIGDAHVGVFNPKYREAIKGDNNSGHGGGYAFNQGDLGPIRVGSRGGIRFNNDPQQPIDTWDLMFAIDPEQSINYVSAHDNLALWDKIEAWAALNGQSGNTDYLKRIQTFANGMVLTSQGIPFIHGGAEMLRTKQGDHNSYRSPDEINKIRWQWKTENEDVFEYYRDAIALRRAHPGFRMNSWDEIDQNVTTSEPRYGVVVNHIDAAANDDDWSEIILIYNSADNYQHPLPDGVWKVAMESADPAAGNDRQVADHVVAEGTAVTVVYR